MNREEIYSSCIEEAFMIVQMITGESKVEQQNKYLNDIKYHSAVKHIIEMLYTMKISEHSKKKTDRQKIELMLNVSNAIENIREFES